MYTRPDGMVETETITTPDDGQEDRSPLEMVETSINHSGSTTATTGSSTPEKETRETTDTLQLSAPSNTPKRGDHPLYRELLERVFQDPVTEERDLEEVMPGSTNEDRQLQEDVKQTQEMRIFQDYLQEHGLREEETDSFENCLFLSIARHMTE